MIKPSPSSATPLRVHFTYTIDSSDGRDERELPFVVGVLADLAPASAKPVAPFAQRSFITVSERTLDALVAGLAPMITLSVPDRLGGDGDRPVRLTFTSMADFGPEAVARQVPELRVLITARGACAAAKRRLWTAPPPPDGDAEPDLARLERFTVLDTLLAASGTVEDAVLARDIMMLTAAVPSGGRDAAAAILDRRILEADGLVGRQLDAILHAPEFQRLEAVWRSLEFMVRRIPAGPNLIIKVLPVSYEELREDLERSSTRKDGVLVLDRHQSALYDFLYTQEYGQHGGEPLGVLVIDHPLTDTPDDIVLLQPLAEIAADAHLPILLGASPRLAGLADFTELGERPIDIAANIASGMGMSSRWKAFRRFETARYVGAVLPRVLARGPHRNGGGRSCFFAYEETIAGRAEKLWMNAAYPLAVRIATAFMHHGWSVAFTGLAGGGGVVDGLQPPDFGLGDEARWPVSPLEVQLTEEQEQALTSAGMIALMPAVEEGCGIFYSAHSAYEPPAGYRGEDTSLSIRLSSRLPYMFAASRVAHYLKVMTRESIGRSQSRIEIESGLNRWLSQYITYQDDASIEARARRPLRDGSVTLKEIEGEPGRYLAEVALQPHFQIEEIDFTLRLKTALEPGTG